MTRTQVASLSDDGLILALQKAADLIAEGTLKRYRGCLTERKTRQRETAQAKADAETIKAEIRRRSYRKSVEARGEQIFVERKSPWCWGDGRQKVTGRV